jgi:hypothetical protein
MNRTILGHIRILGSLVGLILVASCGESTTDADGSGGTSSGGSGGGTHTGGSQSTGSESSGGSDGESGGGGLGGSSAGLGGATGGDGGADSGETGGAPSTSGCSGTPASCSELMGPACAMAGCTQTMACSGEDGCEEYEMPMACDMAPEDCTWGGTCSGEATPCSERAHEPECNQVEGCVWTAP